MISFTQLSNLSIVLRTQGDVHVRFAEADIGEALGGFTVLSETIKKVTRRAVGLKLETFFETDRSLALMPTHLRRFVCRSTYKRGTQHLISNPNQSQLDSERTKPLTGGGDAVEASRVDQTVIVHFHNILILHLWQIFLNRCAQCLNTT